MTTEELLGALREVIDPELGINVVDLGLVEEVEDRLDMSIPLNVLAKVRTIKDFALQLQQLTEEG